MVKAEDVMTKNITSLPKSALIIDAAKAMGRQHISCIVVVDKNENPVGIITERDILNRVVIPHLNPKKEKIEKIMTSDLETVSPNEDIMDIGARMQKRHFRRFPVADKNGLLGLLTETDIVKIENKEMNKLVIMQKGLIVVVFILVLLILVYSYFIFRFAASLI